MLPRLRQVRVLPIEKRTQMVKFGFTAAPLFRVDGVGAFGVTLAMSGSA